MSALVAAAFPWDRKCGTRIVKKRGEVTEADADCGTSGAIDGGTRDGWDRESEIWNRQSQGQAAATSVPLTMAEVVTEERRKNIEATMTVCDLPRYAPLLAAVGTSVDGKLQFPFVTTVRRWAVAGAKLSQGMAVEWLGASFLLLVTRRFQSLVKGNEEEVWMGLSTFLTDPSPIIQGQGKKGFIGSLCLETTSVVDGRIENWASIIGLGLDEKLNAPFKNKLDLSFKQWDPGGIILMKCSRIE